MKPLIPLNLSLVAGLMLLAGCANQVGQAPHQASGRVSVSFPDFKLAHNEYVQSIDLEIRDGRIVSVNRLLDDWDVELVWDNPELLNLKLQARHFVSGLSGLSELDDFVTIENSGDRPFILTAKLLTDSTDDTKRGVQQYGVAHEEFILNIRSPRAKSHRSPDF